MLVKLMSRHSLLALLMLIYNLVMDFQCHIRRLYTRGRIIHLDELGVGKHSLFVWLLVCSIKDGHKTHHPARRPIFCCVT